MQSEKRTAETAKGPQIAQIARQAGIRDSDNDGRQSAVWLAAHFNGRVFERPRQPKLKATASAGTRSLI